MYALGLNAYHPDSSAVIMKDGQLIAAVEEERFCRIKHWAGFPKASIQYCLREARIGIEEVDYLAINRDLYAHLFEKAAFVLRYRPHPSLVMSRLANMTKIRGIMNTLAGALGVLPGKLKCKAHTIEHHRAHLASAFFVSAFEEAAVVSIDGFGDFSSCMVARGRGSTLKALYALHYPHSLGIFYTAFTQLLGFKKFGDEYKVMGLSAYGKPKYVAKMEAVIALKPNGGFALNLDHFSFHKRKEGMLWNNTEPILDDVFSERLIASFGPPRKYEEEISEYHCDLAASLQVTYEKVFFHVLNHAYALTGIPRVCLAGGCALNSLANGKIFERTLFRDVYIQPAASDAGGALGAAYYLYHQILGNPRTFVMEHAYWGSAFSDTELAKVIERGGEALRGCAIEKIEDQYELCRIAAQSISEGKIVGWFQGRMEWGPRALGNRSILADPRRAEMKDILNERIKRREWFRPFAPSILLEKVGEYFEIDYPDPFMLKVYPLKKEKRAIIPAVTHVDGTGRLQTVSEKENPLYWKLIKEFEKISGVPVVLNTSFNENEPIVCTPEEALDCFVRTKMDVLVIDHVVISKQQ